MKIELTLDEAYARASGRLRQKMEYSIRLLQKAERLALAYDSRGGYYLAFSGGKDSQALLHIAQLAGVRYEGHMNLTSVDPPEVIRFVKEHYPEVELIKPKASIYQIAVEKTLLRAVPRGEAQQAAPRPTAQEHQHHQCHRRAHRGLYQRKGKSADISHHPLDRARRVGVPEPRVPRAPLPAL